jgi:hypothetical protein
VGQGMGQALGTYLNRYDVFLKSFSIKADGITWDDFRKSLAILESQKFFSALASRPFLYFKMCFYPYFWGNWCEEFLAFN